jgi:hypothetical protein
VESIYYVLTWLCHRQCAHCYEDRFRPYHGAELVRVVEQSRARFRAIIDHFPGRMTYRDPAHDLEERRGRVILAGGEILLDPVRETVLYPALERLRRKYETRGGVQLVVQTTGDVLTDTILSQLLDRRVNVVSVSGIDGFHAGLERESARDALCEKLTRLFESAGMTPQPADTGTIAEDGRHFELYGASPGSWIGRLWPRGRAHANALSTATLADNFCNGWSGGLNFLQHRLRGSEVSVDPEGRVYPCCVKTVLPIGNLVDDPLEAILDRVVGNPVYEAISMGHPERMGIAHGWSVERFLEKSAVTLASGRVYRNLCVGCDAFHREVLAPRRGTTLR